MKITTKIVQNDIILLEKNKYIKPYSAITLARKNNILGRIEIQHFININQQSIFYSVYVANENDEIISGIYPHGKLNL